MGHGGLVRIDNVHAQLPEGEVGGSAFGSLPETDGLAPGMHLGNGILHGIQFRVYHAALAVPLLGKHAEGAAHQGHPLQLGPGIGFADVSVKTHPFGIIPEVLLGRSVAGNGHLHAFRAAENVREFFQLLNHLRERGFRGALQLYQQHQAVLGTGPHLSAVGAEGANNRVYIQAQEAVFGLQILHFVAHQEFSVMQEDIGLNGLAMLGIGLPEGCRTVIVVVRMQDNRMLGSQGKRQQCCQNKEESFHYL